MELKPLELKVYLVISRAIQRDLHKGLSCTRQIHERAHSGSLGCTQKAVVALCSLGSSAGIREPAYDSPILGSGGVA